jgi:hypothetical protein
LLKVVFNTNNPIVGIFRGVTIHFFHSRAIRIAIFDMYYNTYHDAFYRKLTIPWSPCWSTCFFYIWGRLRTSGNYKYLIFD